MSRPVEIRRLDGSLAERIVPGAATTQEVSAAEFALFAQDRWRLGSRVTLELGLRMDREDVIERVNWSPRGGVSIGVLPEGRGILRGGVGQVPAADAAQRRRVRPVRVAHRSRGSGRTARRSVRR